VTSNGARPAVTTFLTILLTITSILLIALVLLHKGKGGGLSNMFGGGVSSSLGGSAVVEKNLDRMTIVCGLVWVVCVIALGLLLKEPTAAEAL
jgi:preprotein translocase subunit SecG